MSTYVLDASALLALLRKEAGSEKVRRHIGDTQIISAVNWSEVVQKVSWHGLDEAEFRTLIEQIDLEIAAFEQQDAEIAASIYRATKGRGLSLADRACLALAKKTGSVVLTADRSWSDVSVAVRVDVIR